MKVKDYCKTFACMIRRNGSYQDITKDDLDKEVIFSYPALVDTETVRVLVLK